MVERNNSTIWDYYIISLKTAWHASEEAEAIKILESALQEAEDFREIDPFLFAAIDAQAQSYCHQRQYCEARVLYNKLSELQEKIYGAPRPYVARSLKTVSELSGDAHVPNKQIRQEENCTAGMPKRRSIRDNFAWLIITEEQSVV